MKIWAKFLLVAVGLYAAISVLTPLGVDSQMFFPSYASRREVAGTFRIPAGNGDTLAALYLPNPAAKHTIWYFHGNGQALGDVAPLLWEFHRRGYAVFAFDYPGYGVSSGQPSEKSLNAATQAAARYLRENLRVPLGQVILYGRSLGGGPSVELATRERVAGLVLESTFLSVYRVKTRWRLLPFDQFENLRKLPRVACPVLVIHGRQDEVVSFPHGEALFAAAPEPKQYFWVAGAAHNGLIEFAGESYWTALQKFTDTLP